MSVLYVCPTAYVRNYSEHLLDFVDAYDVDEVICGDDSVEEWCDRWFLKKRRMVPHSKALLDCDAVVAFTDCEHDARVRASQLRDVGKPFVVFLCDSHGDVIGYV